MLTGCARGFLLAACLSLRLSCWQQLEVRGSLVAAGSEAEQAQHAGGHMTDMPEGSRRCAIGVRMVMRGTEMCIGCYLGCMLAHGTSRVQGEAAQIQLSSVDTRVEDPASAGAPMITRVSVVACMDIDGACSPMKTVSKLRARAVLLAPARNQGPGRMSF